MANQIKSPTSILGADYPIEVGKNYVKWNSGKLEQWGTLSTLRPSGGIAPGAKYTYSLTYPIVFKEILYGNMTLFPTASGGPILDVNIIPVASSINILYTQIINKDSVTITELRSPTWYALGTWK